MRDAGFGDSHDIPPSYSPFGYFEGRTDRYPEDVSGKGGGIVYVDASVGIRRWFALGVDAAWGRPFLGVTGFRADGNATSGEDGDFLTLDPHISSVSVLATFTTPGSFYMSAGLGPSLHRSSVDVSTTPPITSGSNTYERFSVGETRLGFAMRCNAEIPAGSVRFGFEAQYNYVGSLELGPDNMHDPGFMTTDFDFGYFFVGGSFGFRL